MSLSPENRALVEREWPAEGRPPQPSHGYNSIADNTLNRLLDAARAEGREELAGMIRTITSLHRDGSVLSAFMEDADLREWAPGIEKVHEEPTT